jgi:hypothetical protein
LTKSRSCLWIWVTKVLQKKESLEMRLSRTKILFVYYTVLLACDDRSRGVRGRSEPGVYVFSLNECRVG